MAHRLPFVSPADDIKVLVYEEDNNHQIIWSDYGRVIKCHHQYAIIFQ